jgi:hypothetical protein
MNSRRNAQAHSPARVRSSVSIADTCARVERAWQETETDSFSLDIKRGKLLYEVTSHPNAMDREAFEKWLDEGIGCAKRTAYRLLKVYRFFKADRTESVPRIRMEALAKIGTTRLELVLQVGRKLNAGNTVPGIESISYRDDGIYFVPVGGGLVSVAEYSVRDLRALAPVVQSAAAGTVPSADECQEPTESVAEGDEPSGECQSLENLVSTSDVATQDADSTAAVATVATTEVDASLASPWREASRIDVTVTLVKARRATDGSNFKSYRALNIDLTSGAAEQARHALDDSCDAFVFDEDELSMSYWNATEARWYKGTLTPSE